MEPKSSLFRIFLKGSNFRTLKIDSVIHLQPSLFLKDTWKNLKIGSCDLKRVAYCIRFSEFTSSLQTLEIFII